jgi:hypothetical protein
MSDLDKIANDYYKTRDPKLKELWYKKVKVYAHYCIEKSKIYGGRTKTSTKSRV